MSEQEPEELLKQGDSFWTQDDFSSAFECWVRAKELAAEQGNNSNMLRAQQRLENAGINVAHERKMSFRRVFVGSCMKELHNERKAVRAALELRNMQTFVFEQSVGAKAEGSPRDVWEVELIHGTVYVGLFYEKYGQFTVEECEYALKKGLPCFIYVTDRHIMPGKPVERDVELQAFLDKLNDLTERSGKSTIRIMGKFEDASDLPDKVVNDIIKWLIETAEKARRRAMIVVADLDIAHQKITALNIEIADLKNQFASRTASDQAELQDRQRQISTLEREAQITKQRSIKLQESVNELRDVIAKQAEQILQLQTTRVAVSAIPEPLRKERVAEMIKHALLTQFYAQASLLNTGLYIDVTVQIYISPRYTRKILFRVAEAPFTLAQMQTMQETITDTSIERGALLVTGARLQDPLFNLYEDSRMGVFLVDPTVPGFEKQLLSNTGVLETIVFLHLGDKQFERGDFPGALNWYQAAQSSAAAEKNDELALITGLRIANTWRWMANAWRWIPNVDMEQAIKNAFENATNALALARALNNRPDESLAILRMTEALALRDLRVRWVEIYPILLSGREAARKWQDEHLEVEYLLCLGECMAKLSEQKTALDYLQEALYISQQIEKPPADWQCRIYQTLSTLFLLKREYNEGRRYASLAMGIAREGKRPYFLASAQLALVRIEGVEVLAAQELIIEVLARAKQMGWRGIEQEAQILLNELK